MSDGARSVRDAAARAAVPRNPESRSRPLPPGSLAAAPTRPTSHVAARHFVWRGRRGCLITRGGRSMRTGGGVGLPGRRPLPAIHTPCSHLAPPHAVGCACPPARPRAPAPPSPPRDPAPGPEDPAPTALSARLAFGRVAAFRACPGRHRGPHPSGSAGEKRKAALRPTLRCGG